MVLAIPLRYVQALQSLTICVVHRHFLLVIILIAVGKPAFIIIGKEIFVHSNKFFPPSKTGGFTIQTNEALKNFESFKGI